MLLAEDDVTMVSLLKTLLKMEGFEVIAIDPDSNVPNAIRSASPDVVLMDVHLVDQSGLEILDTIRAAKDIGKVHVVMSSGSNVKEECLAHGADGFILKPYMPDDLITLLKQSVKRRE